MSVSVRSVDLGDSQHEMAEKGQLTAQPQQL